MLNMSFISSETDRNVWQLELEKEFLQKGVDASLIAAFAHEPDQTFESVYDTLQSLVGSSSGNDNNQDGSSTLSINVEEQEKQVEQLLQEWKLIDIESNLAENLNITDEEEGNEEGDEEGEKDSREIREAKRIGEASGNGFLNVEEVASGNKGVAAGSISEDAVVNASKDYSDLAFLIHAFPSRTPIFLQEMLKDENGSVEQVIDTLAVMEMVENGDLDEEYIEEKVQSRRMDRGLDYNLLEKGTGHRKVSKNERRRRKEQASSENAMSGLIKGHSTQKINLTDIRQGGPSVVHLSRKAAAPRRHYNHSEGVVQEDDAAMAARLAAEERKAAGLPSEEEEKETVQDNDWLFSNSILDQLSDLLDIPSHKVRLGHNTSHFNLRATMQRLITLNCQEYPTLADLDRAGSGAPDGTASIIVDGLAILLPFKARSEIERLFRSTKGRQDATIDLIQLVDIVEESAIGEKTDVLDPMKTSRNSQAVVQIEAQTQQAKNGQGKFHFVGQEDPLLPPGDVPYSQITKRSLRNRGTNVHSDARRYALEQLKAGAATTSFPVHSAHTLATSVTPANSSLFDGVKRNETQSEAERLASEYRTIANEYRSRREQSLMQAAHAFRSLPGGGASKQIKGAAAWVYADEARRLDAKARAFSLKAAQATVRHRMMTNRAAISSSSSSSSSATTTTTSTTRLSSDVVDLHGLTVHESLSITKEALSAWWSKSSSGSVHPLYIVTGVGRHSRNHVAVIRPAILKMLNRDGWIVDERREGQIAVKGLR